MAERLVVLSDMHGAKKGLWITSYLGYLQQYFDIVFYDCKDLAAIALEVNSDINIQKEFMEGGIDTAVAHLLTKEVIPSHYLTFSVGGTIAWKAGKQGLPVKSLFAISPMDLHSSWTSPEFPFKLLYGESDPGMPDQAWQYEMGENCRVEPMFGHQLYSDEKIISKVCLELLEVILLKKESKPKKRLSAF